MHTLRAVFKHGVFELLEPLELPEDTAVMLVLVEGDDLPACGVAQTATMGGAFDFLADPREDIYGPEDGKPV